jgi:hypothetical protein
VALTIFDPTKKTCENQEVVVTSQQLLCFTCCKHYPRSIGPWGSRKCHWFRRQTSRWRVVALTMFDLKKEKKLSSSVCVPNLFSFINSFCFLSVPIDIEDVVNMEDDVDAAWTMSQMEEVGFDQCFDFF